MTSWSDDFYKTVAGLSDWDEQISYHAVARGYTYSKRVFERGSTSTKELNMLRMLVSYVIGFDDKFWTCTVRLAVVTVVVILVWW